MKDGPLSRLSRDLMKLTEFSDGVALTDFAGLWPKAEEAKLASDLPQSLDFVRHTYPESPSSEYWGAHLVPAPGGARMNTMMFLEEYPLLTWGAFLLANRVEPEEIETVKQLFRRAGIEAGVPEITAAIKNMRAQYPAPYASLCADLQSYWHGLKLVIIQRYIQHISEAEIYAGLLWAPQEASSRDGNSDTAALPEALSKIDSGPAEVFGAFGMPLAQNTRWLMTLVRGDENIAKVLSFVLREREFDRELNERLLLWQPGERPADFWRWAFCKPHFASSSPAASDLMALQTSCDLIDEQVSWLFSREHAPYQQYLSSRVGQVCVKSGGGDFEEYRPYAQGDAMSSIDWRASSRAGQLLVRTFTEEESRHVHIIYDIQILSESTGSGGVASKQLKDLLLHLFLAEKSGLRVDLTLMGRSILHCWKDIQMPEPGADCPLLRSSNFLMTILNTARAGASFLKKEDIIFHGASRSYDIFAHETPEFTDGWMNIFILHPDSATASAWLPDELAQQGGLARIIITDPDEDPPDIL